MLRKSLAFSEKFEKISLIGRGTFGSVYKVRDRNSFKLYAAKVISLTGMTNIQILKADEERLIHSRLSHPNILKFMQSYLQDDNLIFVMEFCQYGDLHAFIQKRKEDNRNRMPEEVIMNILIQLLYGLQYLHSQGIIHRDIKPSNIFVDSKGAAKIADFGISKVLNPSSINLSIHQMNESKKLHVSGTPLYLSPQSCRNEQITFKSDVWSLGCVLYQLCTLKRVFEADNILALATKINSEEIKIIGGPYSEDLSALVRWMLDKVPENRPQIWQILGLSFVRKYIKAFENKGEQNQYQTPKKLSTSTCNKGSPSSIATDCSPPYKIIERQAFLNESQIVNDHESQNDYYSQLRHSCHNLLGGQEQFAQMYNEIKQLTEQIAIVNEKDSHIIQYKLKVMYGDDYFDISKAMLQLVQYEKKPSKHF